MNLDDLETIWNAEGNRPTPQERAELINRFNDRLRRRRRQELGWLIWTFFVLILLTGFIGWLIFATDKINLRAEWAAIPLLLIPWVFAGVFLRKYRRGTLPASRVDLTISASLRAATADNARERTKLKIMGVMYLIALPVLALSIWQLYAVGKVAPREGLSMVGFLGGALALSAAAVSARYWLGLVPEERQLRGLVKQFEAAAE